MELTLIRIFKGDNYTIGNLYINGVYFCDTLEDTDRGLKDYMTKEDIETIKKSGITAIPTGTYEIVMDIISPRFSQVKQYNPLKNKKGEIIDTKGKLPRLINVKGFSGILIHIGNYAKDTDGCILVGINSQKGAVLNSTETFFNLYKILLKAYDNEESIKIIIKSE